MKVALCHHKDCTVHGILQARILEWAAVLQEALLQDIFSRGRSSLGDLPNPGIEPQSPTLQMDSLPAETPGKPLIHFELIFVPDVREDLTSLFCTWMVGCPLPICSRPLSWLSSTSVSSSGFPSMLVSVSNFPYLLDCP